MDWDTVPDWVNAVGTCLAFAGAAVAASIAWRSYTAQQEAATKQQEATNKQLALYDEVQRRRDEWERRDQANKVAVWFFRGRYVWGVHIRNTSGLPVFDMIANFSSLNPEFSQVVMRGTQGPTEPGESDKLTNALRYVLEEHGALNMHPHDLQIEVAFTDATGIR